MGLPKIIWRRWFVEARAAGFVAVRRWVVCGEPLTRSLLSAGPYTEAQARAMVDDLNRPKRKAGQRGLA